MRLTLSKFLPMSAVVSPRKMQSVEFKINQAKFKLNKKTAKRIQMMRDGVQEQQNAYPCIFIKKKHAPESKVKQLRKLTDSA